MFSSLYRDKYNQNIKPKLSVSNYKKGLFCLIINEFYLSRASRREPLGRTTGSNDRFIF